MFTKSDKNWLKENFATKNDLKGFATKDDLKNFATKDDLRLELNPLKQDAQYIKKDITDMKKDVTDIKDKVNEFASFTINAVGNILEWTQDIHDSIVKEKLPKRVKKLEQILQTS